MSGTRNDPGLTVPFVESLSPPALKGALLLGAAESLRMGKKDVVALSIPTNRVQSVMDGRLLIRTINVLLPENRTPRQLMATTGKRDNLPN